MRMQARNGRVQDGSVPSDPANPTETLSVLRASLWAYKGTYKEKLTGIFFECCD